MTQNPQAVVQIVREKFLSRAKTKDQADRQAFLSELYVFLTDEMHTGMKKVCWWEPHYQTTIVLHSVYPHLQVLSLEDPSPPPPSAIDCDLLKHFAFEAEVQKIHYPPLWPRLEQLYSYTSLIPRLSHHLAFDRLQFLHTTSDQKLDNGKAWEQGYTERFWVYSQFGPWLHCPTYAVHTHIIFYRVQVCRDFELADRYYKEVRWFPHTAVINMSSCSQ